MKIIVLPKKGDQNYRSISLESDICKVFMKVLKNRVYSQLEENQEREKPDLVKVSQKLVTFIR